MGTNVKEATDIQGTKAVPNGASKNNLRKHSKKRGSRTNDHGRKSKTKKISTVPGSLEANKMFLILPTHAENHKGDFNKIILRQKMKQCNNSFCINILDNVEFKVAFTIVDAFMVFFISWGYVLYAWKQTGVEEKQFTHWSYP